MSIPSSVGLREVRLRFSIRRLSLTTGDGMEPGAPYYMDKEEAQETADWLDKLYPDVLHTVEEVELKPEGVKCISL